MNQIIANYVRTTSGGANWYSVPTSKLTPDLLEYFTLRSMRKPEYCIMGEDECSWCTSFEWADQLAISTAISKSTGQLCLVTAPILTAEQRRTAAAALKAAQPAPVAPTAAATNSVDVLPEF